ncbi:helix-turn-helix domain-containing protein [Streptomyces flavochromogenes]|uniref:helix-turn-helix domain-containing protein n=1 Tax=Streptomyces flavochromogenes TaxID=68199 RepID=UPI0004C0B83B|nr:helix-turn-helix transcriptional regulator [Streptomyces flavochromogenes]
MTPGRHTPDPREARTPAEFLARLQALKDWSGLTYRELSARAEARGDVLPRSTVANMLARATLPREELLTAFVRACGATSAELEDWRTVRAELAGRGAYGAAEAEADASTATDAATDTDTDAGAPADPGAAGQVAPDTPGTVGPPPTWPGPDTAAASQGGASGIPSGTRPGTPSRIRRALVATVALTGLVLAGVSVVAFLRDGGTGPAGQHPRAGQPPRTPAAVAPAVGDVRIRLAGTDFCLAERRGTRTGQVHQVPCAASDFPLYSLATVGSGRWRIVSDHPDFGPGCSGIPSGGRIPDSAYEDSECGDPSRVEAFTLEPYGTPEGPVRGYRIVPVGSATPGTCVTVVGDRQAAWARLAQAPCTPDAAGQLFSFDRRD